MNNHCILPKRASFDLKCSKMLADGAPPQTPLECVYDAHQTPYSREGLRAFCARNTLFLSSLMFF